MKVLSNAVRNTVRQIGNQVTRSAGQVQHRASPKLTKEQEAACKKTETKLLQKVRAQAAADPQVEKKVGQLVRKAAADPKIRKNVEHFSKLLSERGSRMSAAEIKSAADLLSKHPMDLSTSRTRRAFATLVRRQVQGKSHLTAAQAATVVSTIREARVPSSRIERAVEGLSTFVERAAPQYARQAAAGIALARMERKDPAKAAQAAVRAWKKDLVEIAKARKPSEAASSRVRAAEAKADEMVSRLKKKAVAAYARVLSGSGLEKEKAEKVAEYLYEVGGPTSDLGQRILMQFCDYRGWRSKTQMEVGMKGLTESMLNATGGLVPETFNGPAKGPYERMSPNPGPKLAEYNAKWRQFGDAFSIIAQGADAALTWVEAFSKAAAAPASAAAAAVFSVGVSAIGGLLTLHQIGRMWNTLDKRQKSLGRYMGWQSAYRTFAMVCTKKNGTWTRYKESTEEALGHSWHIKSQYAQRKAYLRAFDSEFRDTYSRLSRMPLERAAPFAKAMDLLIRDAKER